VCSVGAGVARVGLPAVRKSSAEVQAMGGSSPAMEGGVGKSG
jgi:hypothetical protein